WLANFPREETRTLTSAHVDLESERLGLDVVRAELKQRCKKLHGVSQRLCSCSQLLSVGIIIFFLKLPFGIFDRLVRFVLFGSGLPLSLLSFLPRLFGRLLTLGFILPVCLGIA